MDQATSATGMREETGTPSTSPIEEFLIDLHQRISDVGGGKVADYIPELGKADADTFGVALATVDGETWSADVPLDGAAVFGANGRHARPPQLVLLGPGEELTVTDAVPGTRFLLMAGRPYGETPMFNGPFVD